MKASDMGYIHSLQSLGTVDGPGVRAVVFAAGCPLRCAYCHNPDTWRFEDGMATGVSELFEKIKRLYPYIKDGGVTFSGGEPCMQADFFTELARCLHTAGLHVALDTSGAVLNERVKRLLIEVDLVILDVKFTSEEDYLRYTGGCLSQTVSFLNLLHEMDKPVWIRQVIVPTVNDSEKSIRALAALVREYGNVEKVELLPFRKLCIEKYRSMGIPFPFEHIPDMSQAEIDLLYRYLE